MSVMRQVTYRIIVDTHFNLDCFDLVEMLMVLLTHTHLIAIISNEIVIIVLVDSWDLIRNIFVVAVSFTVHDGDALVSYDRLFCT